MRLCFAVTLLLIPSLQAETRWTKLHRASIAIVAAASAAFGREAIAHPVAGGAAVAGTMAMVAGIRTLFTTKAGRALLLRCNGIKPGSAAMEALWADQIAPMIGRTPGPGGTPPPAAPSTPRTRIPLAAGGAPR